MRAIPAALKTKLDAGVTTLCSCWRIDPAAGAPLGFTDHDQNLSFDGVMFEADSGFTASAMESGLGLSVDNSAATGALKSARINEADIRRGLYDGAKVRRWLVDWTEPTSRVLMFSGEIGEITHGPLAFEVELRGLSERLNRPVGRNYLRVCDAGFGDGRCGVDATAATYLGKGVVADVIDSRTIVASGLGAFATDWFQDGDLRWTGGANAGGAARVRAHVAELGGARIILDRDAVDPMTVGDAFDVVAGCDKRLETCRQKFANVARFRGFPYLPGDGWLAAYPVEGEAHDGGPRG